MAEQEQPVLAFKSCLQTTPRVSKPILSVNNRLGDLGVCKFQLASDGTATTRTHETNSHMFLKAHICRP